MTQQEILEKIRPIISEKTGVAKDTIMLSSRFKEDLAAESLTKYDIVVQMEETFGIVIPDEDTEQIKTIADAVTYLEKRLS